MIVLTGQNIKEEKLGKRKTLRFLAGSTSLVSGESDSVFNLAGTDNFNISFWVYPYLSGSTHTLFSANNDVSCTISSSELKFEYENIDTSMVGVTSIIEDQTLQHYQIELKDANELNIYRNGDFIAGITNANLVDGNPTSFEIGTFEGNIHDLKVYKRALTDLEKYQDIIYSNPRENVNFYFPGCLSSDNLVPDKKPFGEIYEETILHGLTGSDFIFDLDISNIKEGEELNTLEMKFESGFEARRSVWERPLHSFEFSLLTKEYELVEKLKEFFYSKYGITQPFLWYNPVTQKIFQVRFTNSSLEYSIIYKEWAESIGINLSEVR